GFWECHLQPDWLMVWKQNKKELILTFTHTGTHDELF
ncbi:MAG: type II toxin-antitoxin system mRNA interferase toxin, RelE/StbE family, partial [Bacteroidales bacterium]|nr:type II toxin-antitoxin system mRNA interferase toxin, RelE/StbE family [Bacteroidales bacterium]